MEMDLDGGIVMVTVIRRQGVPENVLGRKKAFSISGEAGDLSLPWLEADAARLARKALAEGVFMVEELSDKDCGRSVTLMVEPYLPPPGLVILGGGGIALPLAKLGKMLDYRVTVVDDRPEFASTARFPEVDRVVCVNFDRINKVLDFEPTSSVVIVTRGHRYDLECLRQLVDIPLAYLGMIGSRRRAGLARRRLMEEGFAVEKLEGVHMPIGLDIGAQTPEEIAVSIAAELIRVRRGNVSRSLCGHGAEARGRAAYCEFPSSMDVEILKRAVRSAAGGMPAALATVVMTGGSTPRKAGAKMLVYRDGRVYGTIGGGCGESEVRREALNVIDENTPGLFRVVLDAGVATEEGMACGGVMEVYIDPAGTLAGILGGGDSRSFCF